MATTGRAVVVACAGCGKRLFDAAAPWPRPLGIAVKCTRCPKVNRY